MPLADDMRPQTLNELVGQPHLTGPNGIIAMMVDGRMPLRSLILYGPPGCGKTTTALLLANAANMPMVRLNGVNASVKDIHAAIRGPSEPILLYLDEIQYFNKRQQQSLLPYVEDGSMVLVASTTENPYHDVYDAVLSRCTVLEFKAVTPEEIKGHLVNVARRAGRDDDMTDEAYDAMAQIASGDVRRATNMLELAFERFDAGQPIQAKDVTDILPRASMAGFDKGGNSHYRYISALQKSIRGSDPDAAVFWLTKLLEGGDIISPSRRLLVICSEDIGLACPDAMPHTWACVQAAKTLGLPEAYKPLTQAVLFLALAPKSSSNEPTYQAAVKDIRSGLGATTPRHISSDHAPGYVWPHSYPNHWVEQQYLPDDLVGRTYYTPGDNPTEQSMYAHWAQVREMWRQGPLNTPPIGH